MPKYNQYGPWPASGEIDIMEQRSNAKLVNAAGENIGSQRVSSTLHLGPRWNYDNWQVGLREKINSAPFGNAFHKFQVEWTDSYIKFLIDDVETGTIRPNEGFWTLGNFNNTRVENPWRNSGKMAPFNDAFYLIINLAVGGTNGFFPDDAKNGMGAKPWKNSSPVAFKEFWENRTIWEPTWNRATDQSHLQIDYVKVWAI